MCDTDTGFLVVLGSSCGRTWKQDLEVGLGSRDCAEMLLC
jgi:hypothetical protein